jgi:hypothetical protein
MNSLESGHSLGLASSPRSSANPGPQGSTAKPERLQWRTMVMVATVSLAIVGGVLLTLLYHSFIGAKPQAAAVSAPKPSGPANAADAKDRSLESLGSLTAAHLYQCFLNIGLLADARESDVYTEAESEKLLASVTRMLDSVDRRLGQLLNDGLKDEDKEAVENARQLGELLLAQARELRAYWQTGDKEHADKFQKARQKSWTGIQAVLGIDE